MRSWIVGIGGLAYFETARAEAIVRLEEAIALDESYGAALSSRFAFAFLAVAYAERNERRMALRHARAGILACHEQGALVILTTTLEYSAISLSLLGAHEPASYLYAVVDAGIVGTFALAEIGWQSALRTRGRSLTCATLGPEAIARHQARVASRSVTDVVAGIVGELDRMLAELGDV
jgi:hypothetical protein